MAWKWSGGSKDNSHEEWTGFIDRGVSLEGTLQVTGTFRVDGNIKGNVISEQTLVLGEGAKGVVTGEVHSPCLVIDPGGIFDGRCHMLGSSDSSTSSVTITIRAVSQ